MHTVPPSAFFVHADPRVDAVADRLAWLNDSPDNQLDDYPGPGWDAPSFIPDDADARMVAERHGADHDAQFDPDDVGLWTVPNAEWHDLSALFTRYPDDDVEFDERVRALGHRAFVTAEGGAL